MATVSLPNLLSPVMRDFMCFKIANGLKGLRMEHLERKKSSGPDICPHIFFLHFFFVRSTSSPDFEIQALFEHVFFRKHQVLLYP